MDDVVIKIVVMVVAIAIWLALVFMAERQARKRRSEAGSRS